MIEKTGLIALILLIIVVGSVAGTYIYLKYFQVPPPKVIEEGDCADVHFIERLASNYTIVNSSYSDVINRTGGEPLKVFVSLNKTVPPPENFSSYSSSPLGMIVGFIPDLIGMKEGEEKEVILPPEKAYGIKPKIGDVINFTEIVGEKIAGKNMVFRIIKIRKNATMPKEYIDLYGNKTTDIYVLREDWHHIGETLAEERNKYPAWKNCSVVTKVNETTLWIYITPPYSIGENFTWIEFDERNATRIEYPKNKSAIVNITNETITVRVNASINDTINVSSFSFFGFATTKSYKVENVTEDYINASYTDQSGNKTYKKFKRTFIIKRNQTINITYSYPAEVLEMLLSALRQYNPNFHLSLHKYAGETLVFDIKVERVYKTSRKS